MFDFNIWTVGMGLFISLMLLILKFWKPLKNRWMNYLGYRDYYFSTKQWICSSELNSKVRNLSIRIKKADYTITEVVDYGNKPSGAWDDYEFVGSSRGNIYINGKEQIPFNSKQRKKLGLR